jgi:hypothetical protein
MRFARSSRIIAGIHVLRRLLMPRHPPAALSNLTKKIFLINGVMKIQTPIITRDR